MIIVCGPSKVGKTTGICGFIENSPNWKHVIASKLIAQNGKSVSRLSASAASSNQDIIREELIKSDCTNTILDGHLLVPLTDGFILVGRGVFNDINVSDIIFVHPPIDGAPEFRSKDGGHENLVYIEKSYSEWMANALHSAHHVIAGDKIDTTARLSATLRNIQKTIENKLS